MLLTWSQERNRNISKTCVFIFHHSIQHDEASGYTFYKEITLVFGELCYAFEGKKLFFSHHNFTKKVILSSLKLNLKISHPLR